MSTEKLKITIDQKYEKNRWKASKIALKLTQIRKNNRKWVINHKKNLNDWELTGIIKSLAKNYRKLVKKWRKLIKNHENIPKNKWTQTKNC